MKIIHTRLMSENGSNTALSENSGKIFQSRENLEQIVRIGSYYQLAGLLPNDEGTILLDGTTRPNRALGHQDWVLDEARRGPCVQTH